MSAFPTMPRCFHAVTLFCALLMVLQLVLSLEAKTIKSGRHGHNRGDHNNNHRGSSSSQIPYDAPRLHGGTSFSASGRKPNNNVISRGQMQSSTSPAPDPPQLAVVDDAQSPLLETEEADAYYNNDPDFVTKRQYRIEQIKYHILQKLNLKTAPNVSGVVESSNPSFKELKDKVDKSSDKVHYDNGYQQDMPQEFNEKKIFIPVEENYPFNYTCSNETEIMYFKINPGVIAHARLHLWIKPVSVFSKILMEVFRVSAPRPGEDYVRISLVSSHGENMKHIDGFWTPIHVFPLVSEWTRDPGSNLGMIVKMKDTNNNQIAVTNSYEMPEKAPLLEVEFEHEGPTSNRSIRSSEGGKCSLGETKCCRFPLPINFTEYSFDFIVAPKVYMANFCNGKCDYLYAQQYIHMAVVQKLHNATATYGPCCGAKELMPLNMLYYDHDRKIRFDIINDMIIEKCSCD